MCVSCFSRIDAVGLQSVGLMAAALSTVRRVRILRSGRSRLACRAADWDESAAFLRQLGHEPATLLGPRPVERAPGEVPLPAAREPLLV